MLVKEQIINELYQDAGDVRVQKARLYVKTKRAEIEKIHYENENNFEITGKVRGQDIYRTHIYVVNGEIEDVSAKIIKQDMLLANIL